ncbi:MAG: potassium channel family protein, partial [Methanosarcinaceae archaeon]|nr:potassium channel family protein [Methanosarcinaceae archaeon]
LKTFGIVFKEKKEELYITIFSVSIILIVASSMMYIVENEAQPDVFSSIPASMWWGVITLTTVGYGDVYPITTIGKLLGGIIALLGVGMVALPAGILASGFADIIQKTKEDEIICPHCDRNVNEPKKY